MRPASGRFAPIRLDGVHQNVEYLEYVGASEPRVVADLRIEEFDVRVVLDIPTGSPGDPCMNERVLIVLGHVSSPIPYFFFSSRGNALQSPQPPQYGIPEGGADHIRSHFADPSLIPNRQRRARAT